MNGRPGRRLVLFGLVPFAFVLGLFLFSHQILWSLGSVLVNSGPPVKAEIVVVIGGDWMGDRILKGAELVREGYAPRVLTSGVGNMYGYFESDLAINFAVAHGYPRTAFDALHYPAVSTVDEAHAVIRELRARGIHHYVLVTSEYHTARASRIFRREAQDLDVHVVSSATPYWHGGEWWKEREGRKLWFNEATKTLADYLGNLSPVPRENSFHLLRKRLREHPLARVGPGLITGVADDDPSGIATYSQAGAQFGLNMLWTMALAFPLMAALQSICARIGRVTGKGLAANIKLAFPPFILFGVVLLLLVANTLNIAADVAAMGEVAELVTGFNRHLMTAFFVCGTLFLQVLVPYHRYVYFLKWLTLSLLAYAAVLFTVHVPWGQVALRTVWPQLRLDSTSAAVIVGVFGTTISPYLFFWQASEEVEEMREKRGAAPLVANPRRAGKELRRIRWDTWSGMFYSDVTAWFIILATALTLHTAGVTNIETAAQAASALRPLAGNFAFLLFAAGILGVGLIGVPVLAGSAAYALSEAMGWAWGLDRKATDARGFYGVITVSVLAGLVIQYSPISPMRALFWSAVINGVAAVPLMVVIILLVSKKSVMGQFTAGRSIIILAWIATAVMAAAAVRMFMPG